MPKQKDNPREIEDKESAPETQTADPGLPLNEEKSNEADEAGKSLPSAASSISETSVAIKPVSLNDQFTSSNETLNDPNSKQDVAEYFGLATICFN